jgi:hypothetical protein
MLRLHYITDGPGFRGFQDEFVAAVLLATADRDCRSPCRNTIASPALIGYAVVAATAGPPKASRYGVRAVFMLVDVTNERLAKITNLLESDALKTFVASVLPLDQAQMAHEMLAGAAHERGKIVLKVAD